VIEYQAVPKLDIIEKKVLLQGDSRQSGAKTV